MTDCLDISSLASIAQQPDSSLVLFGCTKYYKSVIDVLALCAHVHGSHLLALMSACIAAHVAGPSCQHCLCRHLWLPPLQGAPSNVHQNQMLEREALGQVFQAAKQGLAAGEPASAFTCPLTMEVFRDPVMSPSGLSYERSALLEHLNKARHR